jgi:cytochrome o ubiquinol oxidase subunit IV
MHQKALALRIFGFIASLILTLVAYFVIINPGFFHLQVTNALIVIFGLAVLQFSVQFICFINIWREKAPRWNLTVFVSLMSIVIIVILGSLWIMHHLNYNMMP